MIEVALVNGGNGIGPGIDRGNAGGGIVGSAGAGIAEGKVAETVVIQRPGPRGGCRRRGIGVAGEGAAMIDNRGGGAGLSDRIVNGSTGVGVVARRVVEGPGVAGVCPGIGVGGAGEVQVRA